MPRWLVILGIFVLLSGGKSAAQPAETKLDPNIYDNYLGTYELSSGELLVIGRSQRVLYFYEPSTGLARGLDHAPSSTPALKWFAGPSFQIFSPVQFEIEYIRKGGMIAGLVLLKPGVATQTAKKVPFYREEKVSFRSGDAILSGTLLIPSTKGPHPAVVCVHGSGEQDRNGFGSIIRFVADHFARHGIATLIYDKRGVGGSTGNWANQTLDDLATDALAGFRMLQNRSDINRKQIGLWGSSQAGWIMPKMAAQTNEIAFIISVSGAGAGISVGDQVLYNLEVDLHNAGFSPDEIAEWKQAYRLLYKIVQTGEGTDTSQLEELVRKLQQNPKLSDAIRVNWFLARSNPKIDWKKRDQWFFLYDPNFDALPLWRQYTGPVLGIFGELDGLAPVSEVVPIFAKILASRKNTDFTIAVFPKAHHILMEMETDTPNDNELPRLKRYVPGYFDTMSEWLSRHVTINIDNSQKTLKR